MNTLELTTHSPQQTQRLGSFIGRLAAGGDLYLLSGNLGTGKTCLVQGIAFGLGVKEYACSPSFMIAREYHGRLKLCHLDLYRLDRIEEIADLGIDEYIREDSVCAIEWAEKGHAALPLANLAVGIEYGRGDERHLSFHPNGGRYTQLIGQLKDMLKADSEEKWNSA